mmetsp:Transcript_57874/g.125657  ORF Transcript_57874/g.125657 Transcript_57874/m.125657 type:complete len:339 (+) Transcript_57874:1010-2026(+)
MAGNQLVNNAPQRPSVDGRVIALGRPEGVRAVREVDQLRRKVLGRAADHVQRRRVGRVAALAALVRLQNLGESKVADFELQRRALLVRLDQQNIPRLEVAVHDTVVVQVSDSLDHLARNVGSLLLDEHLHRRERGEEVAAAHPLHHKEHLVVRFVDVKELQQVLVLQHAPDGDLVVQQADVHAVLANPLHSHRRLVRALPRGHHRAEGALAQQRSNLVRLVELVVRLRNHLRIVTLKLVKRDNADALHVELLELTNHPSVNLVGRSLVQRLDAQLVKARAQLLDPNGAAVVLVMLVEEVVGFLLARERRGGCRRPLLHGRRPRAMHPADAPTAESWMW